jgi:hypothetical protein
METIGYFSGPNVKMLLGDTLRLYVGHGKRFTFAELAAATFDGEGDLRSWERRLRSYVDANASMMPADVFMRVFAALPPAAFQRVASRMGFSTAPMEVDDAATVRRAGTAAARIAAAVAEANEDGQIDHGELIHIAKVAAEELPSINSIASGAVPH